MRNFVLTAAAVFALGLTACGDKEEDTAEVEDTAAVEEVEDTGSEEEAE